MYSESAVARIRRKGTLDGHKNTERPSPVQSTSNYRPGHILNGRAQVCHNVRKIQSKSYQSVDKVHLEVVKRKWQCPSGGYMHLWTYVDAVSETLSNQVLGIHILDDGSQGLLSFIATKYM